MKGLKWAAAGALSAAVAAGIVAGCIRTYVYEYADGTRIETSSPNSMQMRIDVSNLRGEPDGYAGQWSAPHWREPRGTIQVVVHSDQPHVRHYWHFQEREITKVTQPSQPQNEITFDVRRPAGTMSFHG